VLKKLTKNVIDREISRSAEPVGVSDELLKQAVYQTSVGILISDAQQPDHPIIFANPFFEQLTGYSKEEVLGRNCRFLQGNDTTQPNLKQVRKAIKEGSACKAVLRNYRKDGSLFYNELTLSPICDADNNITHFLGIQKNITAQMDAENKLKQGIEEKENRYSAYMQHATECIWRLDLFPPISLGSPEEQQVQEVFSNTIITEANDAMARFYHLKKGKELIGKPLKEVFPQTEPRNVEAVYEIVRKQYSIKGMISYERSVDGKEIAGLNNMTPVIKNNQLICVWGTTQDITEFLEIQTKLEQSEKELIEQKIVLEQKNIVLRELIAQIELEKNELKDQIMSNLQNIVFPSLEKLKLESDVNGHIDYLHKTLENLSSSFGRRIFENKLKLSPREIEVCNMVKNGLTNKEISKLLHIALHTVEKHRRMARKKLGISNTKTNLTTYLQSL
jgi:PAS domain S-box-containing protein